MEKLFELFYECNSVCTDTRKITLDCLFICLSGENFNGNTFAQQAIELGAKYVIVDDKDFINSERIFYVKNSLIFLQKLANYHRKQFSLPVIGITGSNGKTSTKELINCVLSKKYKTLATEGNLNNHIGVPLTLLRLTNSHEIAIIEMGANKFKDIEELCDIAEPNFGIITNIGKAHLEGFLNFEGVLKTKKELYTAVANKKGVLFYNFEDDILKTNLPMEVEKISYGIDLKADISGELCALTPFVKLKWMSNQFKSLEIETSMIGKYNFYNFLAAIAIGTYFKVSNKEICEAVRDYQPSNNRSQVQKTKNNTLILDAYNANPTSMRSAIESFALIEKNNKIAILGDMFELGAETETEHKTICELIQKQNFKTYFVGSRFFSFKQLENESISFFENKNSLKDHFEKHPLNQSLILLKGSRGIGLEELVEKL